MKTQRWRHGLILLVCVLSLGGCTVRLLYNWLDWAIAWKVDDYFDLTSAQSRVLKQQVAGLLRWHRTEQLPQYVLALRELSSDLKTPLTEQQVEHHLQTFERLSRQLADGLKGPANKVAVTLTDDQVKNFTKERWNKLGKDRAEYREQGGVKVYNSFKRKLEKNLKNWIGDLTPAQQPLVAQSAQWQQQYYATWLDHQTCWVQAIERMLAQRGKPEFETELVNVLLKGSELGDGRFKQYIDDSHARSVKWFAALTASLTDRQRQTLRDKIDDLASDLESLNPR